MSFCTHIVGASWWRPAQLGAAALLAASCAGTATLPSSTAAPALTDPPVAPDTLPATTTSQAGDPLPAWPPAGMPAHELYPLVEACIEDRGFVVTVNAEERYVEFRYDDPDQLARANEAMDACFEAVDPAHGSPPFSEAQLRELYPYMVEQARCLAAAGYPPEPQSFDVFAWDLQGLWDPAGALAASGVQLDASDVTACRSVGRPRWLR